MPHVIVFAGEYDLANSDALRRFLSHLETCDDLVFDLTEVTFIDSTFLTELIHIEKVRKANKLDQLTIVSPAESALRRLFDITGLASVVSFVETFGRDDPDTVVEFAPPGEVYGTTLGDLAALEEDA